MITDFVQRWDARRGIAEAALTTKHPESYDDVVKAVVTALHDDDAYGSIDPERIHRIDDGHYQGTLVYVIGASGYRPSNYWYVKVGYGSCSGCDTLEAIKGYRDEAPTAEQVKDYMALALHIVQGLKKMGDEEA